MPLLRYEINILPSARKDINKLHDYIAIDLCAPITAEKYLRGVYATIAKLAWLGGSIGVSLNKNLRRQYGTSVRTINYKNMTIIYTVHGNLVAVHRVIAGRNIK
jgi:plasmid stabilization system protein ParE